MITANGIYKHLGPQEGSPYQQCFVKGRSLRAATLYEETLEPEALSPEEVAEDYDVPVEAVLEAIDYCTRNADLLHKESEEENAWHRSHGYDAPPFVPPTVFAFENSPRFPLKKRENVLPVAYVEQGRQPQATTRCPFLCRFRCVRDVSPLIAAGSNAKAVEEYLSAARPRRH